MIPKFRAWDRTTNQMRGCYGFNEVEQEVYVCSVADYEFNGQLKTFYAIKRSFHEVVIMQSTGLEDKNGVEIYEGDIVHVLDRLNETPFEAEGHIVYEQDDCAFEIALGLHRYSLHKTKFVEYEIIGNIYEHGHLLK